MPPGRQVGVKGKVVNAQSREVIANVLKFMKKEAMRGSPLIPLASYKQRLIEATGISDKVYRQVASDLHLIESGKQSCFRAPMRSTKSKYTIEIVDELMFEQPEELGNEDNKGFSNENGLGNR